MKALLRRLATAQSNYVKARNERVRATERREEVILAAFEAGVPTRDIMEVTGLDQANVARAKRRARARRQKQ